jgi:superfamily II DNA or RNA helicase
MKLPEKEWDAKERCWSVPQYLISGVQAIFKDVQFLDEVKVVKTSYDNSAYADMGKTMKLQPYDYQKEAIKFGIDNHNILIVYPCGSGKTPIGIGIYLEARDNKIIKGPGMFVVKASLKTQWLREVEKFSDLKATIIKTEADITENIKDKIKRRKAKIKKLDPTVCKDEIKAIKQEIKDFNVEMESVFKQQFDGFDIYILNYETLKNAKVRAELHKRKINFIFADEIHYVKSRTAKRSEALCEFGDIKMKIGATATPVGKNPEDLYGIFNFVCPTLFPSWSQFAKLYIRYAGFGRIAEFRNLDHLRKKISPYLIVKTKEEVSEQLPSLMVMQRYCDLTADQEEVTTRIMIELEDLKEKEKAIRCRIKSEAEAKSNQELMKIDAKILALQTFAQEVADAPQLLSLSKSEMAKDFLCGDDSPKIDMLIELLEEIINSGEKVAIFSKFERMQPILTEKIHELDKSIKIAYVNGKLNDKKRYEEVYTKFRDDDDYKVLLMSDAGAEGLNLSLCKYIIEFDLAESYAIQTQRHGRIERSDSVHDTVFVYQLIANDSWDQIQQKIVEKKEGYDTELIKSLATSYEGE